jgi:hypothetical protein
VYFLPYISLLSPADLYCPVLSCIVPGFSHFTRLSVLGGLLGNLCALFHQHALIYLKLCWLSGRGLLLHLAATETAFSHCRPLMKCVKFVFLQFRSSRSSDWYLYVITPG